MADAYTNPYPETDLFLPTLANEYLAYEFKDNLSLLDNCVGEGPAAPIRLVDFGFLREGGIYVQQPRFKKVSAWSPGATWPIRRAAWTRSSSPRPKNAAS